MSKIRKFWLFDAVGNAINSLNNAINVHVTDVHFEALSLHAKLDSGTSETFGASGAAVGVNSFDVASGQGSTFSVNDRIKITEGTIVESDILRIISVVSDTITIDRPLENTYTSAGIIEITDIDLSNANGSIAVPVIYEIGPPSNEIWHLTIMSIIMIDGPDPVIEKFSGISELTNGLAIRQNNGSIINHFVIKNNGDLREYFGGNEIDIQQRGGGGDYMISGLWHLQEHSSAIVKLDGSTNDTLQFIIQDNLTDITNIEIVCQGHKEE